MSTTFKMLGSSTELPPQIDRYELVAEIASGGMATVYLARLLGVGGFQRFFAVKRLHPHLGSDEAFVQMFLDEARLVAAIRHQHVVPVLEVGAGESGYYLVMEYIEGESFSGILGRVVKQGRRIPPGVSVRIVLDMLAGLNAAHDLRDGGGKTLGVVHRDVSPQNILLDTDGIARISDFGVAHATSRLSTTRAGQLKGKVAYMAPEQARGEHVTRSADVFAAGIVLWEALCRKRLFMAANEAVTLNNLMFEPIPLLRQGNPTMSAALEKVLQKALDRDPSQRYSTAAEFAEAIEGAARASRMLGTSQEVKTFVLSLLGPEIDQRRDALRDHLAVIDRLKHESSRPGASGVSKLPVPAKPDPAQVSSVSSAAMEIPTGPSVAAGGASTSAQWPAAATPPTVSSGNGLRIALLIAATLSVGVIAAAIVLAKGGVMSPVSQSPAGPPSASPSGASPPASVVRPSDSAHPPASAASSATDDLDIEPSSTGSGAKRPVVPGKVAAPVPVPVSVETPATASTIDKPGGSPPSATDDMRHNPYRH